jgi:hypothetical protein
VRPVTLVSAKPTQRARELARFRTTSVIARADVAQWMLDRLASPAESSTRTPQIGWW